MYETLKDVAIKQYGCETERDLSSLYRLCAGGIAGTVGQTIAYPFDVVRRRLQVPRCLACLFTVACLRAPLAVNLLKARHILFQALQPVALPETRAAARVAKLFVQAR